MRDAETETEMETEERERARFQKLIDIAFLSRKGEVEGVAFDLTFQPDFNWSCWEQVNGMGWLDCTGTRLLSAGPRVIWPWSERPLSGSELRAEAGEILTECVSPNLDPAGIDEYIADRLPDIEVRAGDSVFVSRIKTNLSKDYLQAPENVDTLDAYLTVHRATGEAIEIGQPLEHRRVGHLNTAFELLPLQMEIRAGARANITSEAKFDELLQARLHEGRVAESAEDAFLAIHEANNDLTRLLGQMEHCLPANEETERLVLAVRRLAGRFAAAGYALARSESETYAVPFAERALASKAGTDAGAAAKRKKGELIRNAAKAFIRANPNTSKSACARHVVQLLGKDQRGVERAIAELFVPRNLPGKQDKRPRKGL
ncbi:Uncharacterised protein [Brevundimonas diminuta]|uniref:Uncharacterized protein n=2 Tax=Brevundimonas diminuta TaxID=293 RepID=A0A2X1ART1_BREDI|nr:Uncharacterised protein [Brevundimonas diminuta]